MLSGCVWTGLWWSLPRQDHGESNEKENDQEDNSVGDDSQEENALGRHVDGEGEHGSLETGATVVVEIFVVLRTVSRCDVFARHVNAPEFLS